MHHFHIKQFQSITFWIVEKKECQFKICFRYCEWEFSAGRSTQVWDLDSKSTLFCELIIFNQLTYGIPTVFVNIYVIFCY